MQVRKINTDAEWKELLNLVSFWLSKDCRKFNRHCSIRERGEKVYRRCNCYVDLKSLFTKGRFLKVQEWVI